MCRHRARSTRANAMLLFAGDHRCLRCAVLHTHVQSLSTAAALPRRRARWLATIWAPGTGSCPLLVSSAATLQTTRRCRRVASDHARCNWRALCTSARARDPATYRDSAPLGTLTPSWLVTFNSAAAMGDSLCCMLDCLHIQMCGLLALGPHVVETRSMLALSLQRRFCWLPVPDAAVWFRTPDLCARTYFGISYGTCGPCVRVLSN